MKNIISILLSVISFVRKSFPSIFFTNLPKHSYSESNSSFEDERKKGRRKKKRNKSVAVTMLERDAAHNVAARNRGRPGVEEKRVKKVRVGYSCNQISGPEDDLKRGKRWTTRVD